ncbi:hypothetical protein ACFE04_003477 [Oxalis oulophora]
MAMMMMMGGTITSDINRVSRKAEESALRRYEAAHWLDCIVGPLGLSNQPTEREFISCLRNGLILCNVINKIHPGAVPKVVEINSHLAPSLTREPQPLTAYQYFENVRNFLVALDELKIPAFEASDLERESVEAGSAAKVVDCILALKSYHEWKQLTGNNGSYKHARSPMMMQSATKIYSQVSSDTCRKLDMCVPKENRLPTDRETQILQECILKVLTECMVGSKENMDENLFVDYRNGNLDSVKLLRKIISSCFDEQVQKKFPEKQLRSKSYNLKSSDSPAPITSSPLADISRRGNSQHSKASLKKAKTIHRQLIQTQQKEVLDLKALLSKTKTEFADMQLQFQLDMKELESQVQEMSTAALGYHRVVKENRNLHNMVQDLKGNIRVYCRIRPAFSAETRNVIDFIGEDGSLIIQDPLKPQKDGRKSGPSDDSSKDRGINYLALNDLFQLSDKRKDMITYDIHVQMVEVYNEQLEIRSCNAENGSSLPDARMHYVKCTGDVLNLMKLGEVNRVVSSTALNDRSSRSHSILTVHVHGKDASGSITRSCLHLVDLAGSERVDKSEVTGDRLKEAQHINKSLSCLGDVITALANKNSHIPYRNSKLTLLLQDSLGGHAKTLMFAHISPEGDSFGETISTLKFAQRVSTVELGAARSNKESSEVMQLKEQIESLKKALANKESSKATMDRTPPRVRRLSIENGKKAPMTERTPPRVRRLSIENGKKAPMTEQTPPRVRRLSIESGKKAPMTEKTPPRTRRLSIENGRSTVKTKDPKSPRQNPKSMTERRTPPRARRLSIENGSTVKSIKTPSVPSRARRLSLEGPNYKKGNIKTPGESVSTQKGQYQDSEATFKNSQAPRSPIRASFQTKTQIPSFQLPKTPEQHIIVGNEVQISIQSQVILPTKPTTTSGKGSKIKRSLRTIGKLINKEKRNHPQISKEVAKCPAILLSPVRSVTKSPLVMASSSALRRQSLTGIPTPGTDRRSSLGGKSTESNSSERKNIDNKNVMSPFPAQSAKRWA